MACSFCYIKWQNHNFCSCVLHCRLETVAKSKDTFLWRYLHKPHNSTSQSQMNLSSNITVKQGSQFIFFSQTGTWGTERLKPRFRQFECQLNLKVLCFQLARCLWHSVQGHIGCLWQNWKLNLIFSPPK